MQSSGLRLRSCWGKRRTRRRGGAELKVAVPKRKHFGEEGDEGDAAHEAAMQQFSLHSFGSSHVQLRTSDKRLGKVGLMGDWLEQSGYGAYVKWEVKHGVHGMERDVVVVERDGLASWQGSLRRPR